MKIILVSLLLACSWTLSYAAEFKFGQICITPYQTQQQNITTSVNDILITKMSQMLMNNEVATDRSGRFIMLPGITINNVGTTATFPPKTSVNITVIFAIGDGETGARYSCYTESVTGIGDDINNALSSAVRKIKTSGTELENFVRRGTTGIIEYYNNNSPSLLKQANISMASGDYEQAIVLLAPIPSFCTYYNEAQLILQTCGSKILARDNEQYLLKAQSAWAANPDISGAEAAKSFISEIINPTATIKNKIEILNTNIQNTLTERELREHELTKLHISTQADIQQAEIQASASVASAFFSSIPKLVISALRWF